MIRVLESNSRNEGTREGPVVIFYNNCFSILNQAIFNY